MNRRTRHLMVLVLAVITASIASFGVYRAVDRMPGREGEVTFQPVVMAARAMPLGTLVTEKDVKVVSWPSNSLVPGAISHVKDVVNRGLLTAVEENDVRTTSKIAGADSGAGLPPAIPPGMRAISVKVNDVIGVAGFVAPGNRVDLIVTIQGRDDSMTHTVASNVQVLTAGTRQQQGKTESDGKNETTVVTLVVTPEDALRIALAQSHGQIMLVLRNPSDKEPTVALGVRTGALLGQAATAVDTKPAPAPAPRRRPAPTEAPAIVLPPQPPPQRMVETIRAQKRTDEVIK